MQWPERSARRTSSTSGAASQAPASAADLRKHTLTELYNQPMRLALAHTKLDEAVLDAYGWPHDLSDEEILANLLRMNLERASAGAEVPSGKS